MTDIFISHSHEDKAFGEKIAKALKERHFSVWIDNHIETGDQWIDKIKDAIKECVVMVVIMTPSADKSDWVKREILLAERLNKPIFPLLLAGEELLLLITRQYEDVRTGMLPSEKFFQRLARIIELSSAPVDAQNELEKLKEYIDDLEVHLSETQEELTEAREKLEEYEDLIEEHKAQDMKRHISESGQRSLFDDYLK